MSAIRTPSTNPTAGAAFEAALPVWIAGRERERNLTVSFSAVLPGGSQSLLLRATGSTVYRALLEGELAGYGPARAAHGFFRVDEWRIEGAPSGVSRLLRIEVAGYNVNSYYHLDQPSFLQAEVLVAGKVLAATGIPGLDFAWSAVSERVQRVQRYSFQRPFIEAYRPRADAREPGTAQPESCAVQPAGRLLPRGAPYPDFSVRRPAIFIKRGRITKNPPPATPWKDRSLTGIGPTLGGYREAELEEHVSDGLQELAFRPTASFRAGEPRFPVRLPADGYLLADFGCNLTGFIEVRVDGPRGARFQVVFDEILSGEEVDPFRLQCVNAVTWDLPPGAHRLLSFEPYTFRYLKLMALGGSLRVRELALREYANPTLAGGRLSCDDPVIGSVFEAARETLRQNALDVFSDCPSRERAGWLCDSFFAARALFDFTGSPAFERTFLENFLLPDRFEGLPEGMLPMCYPADHPNGVHIPQWALWFVLQLEEYAGRSGDHALARAFRPRVEALFHYLDRFLNEQELLERLPGWNFIEWSKANELINDVHFPTNLLYAGALDAAGRLYHERSWRNRAAALREIVANLSYDGVFFRDRALREEGAAPRPAPEHSEIAQYMAFTFGAAAPESHPELWRTLVERCAPGRPDRPPGLHPANAFIGHYLRLELLSRFGCAAQAIDETKAFFGPMAETTGTLWEHRDTRASCNHGFAAHVARVYFRDLLGLRRIDPVRRRITLRFARHTIRRCEGRIPLPHGEIRLAWRRTGDRVRYRLHAPAGYRVRVEDGGLESIEEARRS